MSGLSFSLGSKRPAGEAAGQKPQSKKPAKVSDLFGADSDGEEDTAPAQGVKKLRTLAPVPFQGTAASQQPAGPSNPRPASVPAAATPSQQQDEAERQRCAKEKSDSLAAMDAYMKMMAKKAADKEAADQEENERKNRVPLLNETAFDRRKVTAVFKTDGSRGHHMSDFIPPEELAKLLAQGGDAAAKAAAEAMEKKNAINSDNIGHKLLSKMGWKEGEAVGAGKSGITAPIAAGSMKQDNLGLGAETHGQVNEGDDAFEQYRKRMMLGYKHRPSPLGNPRKAYY